MTANPHYLPSYTNDQNMESFNFRTMQSYFKSADRNQPTLSKEQAQVWKKFNPDPQNTFKAKVNRNLAAEQQMLIRKAIRHRLHKSALGTRNIDTPTNPLRIPSIEQHDKLTGENNRFYNNWDHQKKHGIKYIPPPVAETVQQLLDEKKLANSTQKKFMVGTRFQQ